ncbi:MAG: PulJ/GspJ family protein [Chthoniobacterales bacterium]
MKRRRGGLTAIPFRRRRSAFTLIELMVSMAILCVLIVILMSMVDGATKLWRMSENRVDSYREARAAINTISADLGGLLVSTNEHLFSYDTDTQLPSSAIKPPDASTIFFLSGQAGNSQDHPNAQSSSSLDPNRGDLCVVGYFLAFDNITTSGPKSLNLYRYFKSSGDAFSAIQQQTLLPQALSTGPTGAEVLARNITKFKIEAYSVGLDGSVSEYKYSRDTPVPDFLDVELTALNNETVKRFKPDDKTEWLDTNSLAHKQNARTFRTRVRLRAESVTRLPTPTPTPTPTPAP